MEFNHVGKTFESENAVNSVFTLFSNLTGEQNQNPKYCVELLKLLNRNRIAVGSIDNFKYSIKRLVKALGSTRLHSQCGCFACLAGLLKFGVVSVQDVLSALEKEEKNVEGATKSEIKALNTEVVLSCGAIIHSGLFAEQGSSTQLFLLKKLIECGKKKSYLFTVACRFVIDVIYCIDETAFSESIWPLCKTEIFKNLTDCNVDTYHLLMVCMTKNSHLVNNYIRKQFDSKMLFLEQVARYCFNNSIKSTHPIYVSFAEIACHNNDILKKIWTQCVEEYGKISSIKDNLLVALFAQITRYLNNANIIPLLLVPKFVDILITVLNFKKTKTAKDNSYHVMANEALSTIEALLKGEKSSEETKIATIETLLLFPANLKFELKTGNKIIQRLILQLNSASTLKMLQLYQQIIADNVKKTGIKGTEENWNNKEKQIALHNLVKTINHPAIRSHIDFKLDQIKFIFDIAFIRKGELFSDFRKYAQDCFYKAIMLQMPTLKDLVFLLGELATYVNNHVINGNVEMTENAKIWWVKQYSTVQKLQQEPSNKFFITVHVLLVYMGFQLFTDPNLAEGSIEELLSCYSHLKKVEKKPKGSCKGKSTTSEEPHWTEVTMDLILSLLSRENKLWRHVICRIFPQVVVHATPAALRQIFDALDPKSPDTLLEEFNSDEGDENEESSDSDSQSSSEESDLEDGDLEEKATDQLRMAVREALGHSAGLTDDESVDMDLMDPEEEERLNESLAQAFRLHRWPSRGKKKKQTKEEEALMHFRLRLLDLIQIYLTNGPSLRGCLDLILPLLSLLEFSIKDPHQSPLKLRVDSVIRTVSSVKHFSTTDDVDEGQIEDLFRAVVDKKDISTLVFVEMAPRISECAAFFVRCSQCLPNEKAHEALVPEYQALLKAFCTSRDFKLPAAMFQTVLRMTWKGNFKLVSTLYECLTAPNVKVFKKIKLLELLHTFYKNEKLHASGDHASKLDLTETEAKFVQAFADRLASHEDQESRTTHKMLATFFSQLIVLINAARTNAARHRTEGRTGPWGDLISAMASQETCSRSKKTRSQLGNLAKALNVPLPEMDSNDHSEKGRSGFGGSEDDGRAHEEEEQEQDFNGDLMEPPKRKKRKKHDSRKESRKLRSEVSSEGYANEVGEAFRPLVHRFWVNASYGVASLYVLADTVDKTLKADKLEKTKPSYERSKVAAAAADTLIWQALASVIIPGFTINRICALTFFSLSKLTRVAASTRKWTTTAVGLGSIPFIVTPIDHFVDILLNKTLRPILR